MAIDIPKPVPQEKPGPIQSVGTQKYMQKLSAYSGARRDFINRPMYRNPRLLQDNPWQLRFLRPPSNTSNQNRSSGVTPSSPGGKPTLAEAARRRAMRGKQ